MSGLTGLLQSLESTYMQESWSKNHHDGVGSENLLLEPIASIAGCKQYMPQKIAAVLLSSETGDTSLSVPMREALLKYQRLDPFVNIGSTKRTHNEVNLDVVNTRTFDRQTNKGSSDLIIKYISQTTGLCAVNLSAYIMMIKQLDT
jgi:hypothetical protein